MPADPLTQVRDMAVAGGVVLAVAVPVAAGCAVVAQQLGRRVVPRWRHQHSPWTGFDILFLFFWQQLLTAAALSGLTAVGFFHRVYGPEFPTPALVPNPLGAAGGGAAGPAVKELMRPFQTTGGLWAMTLAVPLTLLTAWGLRALVHGDRWVPAVRELPGRVALGFAAWVVVTPAVFVVYFATLVAAGHLGVEPDQHPLSRMGVGGGLLDRIIFGVAVCFVTPLGEEFIFRGLMVRWAAGRRYRPWALIAASGLAALLPGLSGESVAAPTAFIVVLAVGLYLLHQFGLAAWPRFPVRTVAAVYASAAVFAAAHSAVWPTPVPLFALGLALGYLAARAGGIAACVTLHGLFNAVSFVYLLRGGT